MRVLAGAMIAALVVAGCAGGPPIPWQSALGREHPLTGRIWDAGAGRFVDDDTLVRRLAGARFVLLGEKHDNPDHHRLQVRVLRALVAAGRRPAVGFEMFEVSDAPALARHLATAPGDAAGLGEAVDWGRSGWPPWELYRPIAETAVAAGLPIVATNLARGVARTLAREGVAGADRTLVAGLGLDRPLPPETRTAMAEEIREAHCGRIAEARIEGMIAAQRGRDAQMARSLVEASTRDGAVLIAGAGHVRNDRGIPAHLAVLAPGAPVASLAFFEVSADRREPEAYASRSDATRLPFDYAWFTPRVDDDDPCERFKDGAAGS